MAPTDGAACRVTDQKDPCAQERANSMKCLEKNNYDHSACEKQFANYKSCKTFWMNVRRGRAYNRIYPHLPDMDERIRIKKKYMDAGMQGEVPLTG